MRFRHLPKVELHCHVDGIVDPAMLRAIEARGLALPVSAETLAAAYPVRSLEAFINWFEVADPLEREEGCFHPILAQHIERLVAQNVVYAEIMLGTSELPRDGGRLVEAFAEFREFVTELEAGRIQVEFLVAVGRQATLERLEWVADRAIRLREAGLLFGLALAGWPETPIQHLAPALRRLRDAGLGIEIHAGEWAGPELVWDALEHGRPHRLGHGVSIFRDPRLIERVRRDGVHIEMCPTSNLRTGSVARIEQHPVRQARDLALDYSLNTDDPGPFENTLESEYALLADSLGFQPADFERIASNALNARFQPALRHPGRLTGVLP